MNHKRLQAMLSLVLLMVLAGCASQGMSLTLAADHHIKGTEFYEIEVTASVQVGRLQSTQDYYTTQAAYVATQSQFLKTTLVARGTPVEVLDAYQQQIESGGLSLPTRTPRPTPTFAPLIPPTPMSIAGGPTQDATSLFVQGNIVSTANATLPFVAPTFGPRLVNLTTAPGVMDNDCAQNPSLSFPIGTPEIYLVATAYEVTSGMTLESHWEISGQERTFNFAPDFNIDGACIWFYIDQSEFSFQPGTARVSLTLDGNAMGTVEFTLQ